jgi:hypothetical protein
VRSGVWCVAGVVCSWCGGRRRGARHGVQLLAQGCECGWMRLCSCYDMHLPAASEASRASCACAACLPASAHLVV